MRPTLRTTVAPLAVLLSACVTASVHAEPTELKVRAIAKGAKYVGTSMGGVRIIVSDAATGQILAQGVTHGTTGDTQRLMKAELLRRAARSTPEAAAFATTLDLDEPRQVRITAQGPLGQPQAMAEVSTTVWIAPGLHVTGGDAIELELPGFAVDVIQPVAHEVVRAPGRVELLANVVMMCGCPLEPGGLWNSEQMRFVVFVYRDGKEVARVPAEYGGQRNRFRAEIAIDEPGAYRARFVAFDPSDGNTGVDDVTFIAAPKK